MQSYSFSAAAAPGNQPVVTPVPQPGPTVVPKPAPPKPRKLGWIVWLSIVVIAAGAFAWYKYGRPAARTPAQLTIVPTITIGSADLAATVRIAGTVAAQNYASIMAPRIQGNRGNFNRGGQGGQGPNGNNNDFALLLTNLAVPGAEVKSGDIVAEFDTQAQQQRLDDYKDSVVQMDANIGRLKANLAASKESLAQQVRSAKADWDKALLDLKTAPIRSAIDAEKYQIAVDQNREAYEQLVKQAQLQEVSQTSQIRASELDRDQSKIELERAQQNIERMKMRTPINGIAVLQTLFRQGQMAQVRVGDQVNAGQPFLSVVDPSSMVVNASVNQVEAQKVRLGQKARIHLDAYPDIELPGTVIGIGALSKTSNIRASYVSEIPVRVRIDQGKVDSRIIPDLTASAEIIVGAEENAVVAPRSAVFAENGKPFVFVQSPTGWTRRDVEVGLESNTMAAIRSGLQKGSVIAAQRPL
jgi:multidrug efflux pump subunit AcrA (membrane-fusion protein)